MSSATSAARGVSATSTLGTTIPGGGPTGASSVSSNWGQYQSTASHNGVSSAAGPVASTVNWSAPEGSGEVSVNGVGVDLLVSSWENDEVNELTLSNGTMVNHYSPDFLTEVPAAVAPYVYYVQEYSYSCGIFCTAYGSQLVQLDYSTGAIPWATDLTGVEEHWTVAEDNGFAYTAALGTSTVYACDTSTGALTWTQTLLGPISTEPTYGSGLVVFGYSNERNVTALSYYNGAFAWNATLNAPIGTGSIASASNHFYLGTDAGTLYALSTKGAVSWTYSDGNVPIDTTPTVVGPDVYFGAGNYVYAVNDTGALLWKSSVMGVADVSPVVSTSSHLVYAGDSAGYVYAFNITTGKKQWSSFLHAPVEDGLVLGTGELIATDANGYVHVFGPVAGPATSYKHIENSAWTQYQGSASHDGLSPLPGPLSNKKLWRLTGSGGGPAGLTAVGNTLIAANEANDTVEEFELGTGTTVNTGLAGGTVESLADVQSLDNYDLYLTREYSYSCGIFCTAYGSELADGNYALTQASTGTAWASAYPLSPTWAEASADGIVVSANLGGTLLTAVSPASGAILWSVTFPHLLSTTPTIGDDLVVVGFSNSANVTALDLTTGQIVWNYTADAPVTSPAVSFSGSDFYFGTALGHVYAVSGHGKKVWNVSHSGGASISTTPAIAGTKVFFGASNGVLYGVYAKNGSVVWSSHIGASVTASPVVATDTPTDIVYAGTSDGHVAALDATNGTVLWKVTMPVSVGDGLLLADGILVATDTSGDIWVFT